MEVELIPTTHGGLDLGVWAFFVQPHDNKQSK